MRHVVVGGGMAGVTAAQTLRTLDHAAAVFLVEAEAVPHYLRPGLIEVLAGKKRNCAR
ncbi:MAG: FAD-dependent oxidoreductase [Candidatus Bipolaricaulaceae bacterium]